MSKNDCNSIILLGVAILASICSFLMVINTPFVDIISAKEWYSGTPEITFHLGLVFLLAYLYYSFQDFVMVSAIGLISSAVLKALGRSLKNSSVFSLNMSPPYDTLNGSLVNLYLPN